MFENTKIIQCLLSLVFIFQSCNTVEKYNAQIGNNKSIEDLKFDVYYVQNKLEKLQPDLYHYISKKDLDYKFDSLRTTLTYPMNSKEFYFKLSPIIASIRQGHTQIFPLSKKLHFHEMQIVAKQGATPLDKFDFELFNNKLYIVKNYSNDSTIKPGTEILSINGAKPIDIINKYKNTFASDGYNTTFFNRRYAIKFPRFLYYENGILDSLNCELGYSDSLQKKNLKRIENSIKIDESKSKIKLKKAFNLSKPENVKRKLQGYNSLKKIYSKELSFPVNDSSVAILKISDFMIGNYKQFYKKVFRQLDLLKTKSLIIDLRDNPGGRLSEIAYLYSYLADSCYHFIEKSEVTSKTSLWHIGFFNKSPLWKQVVFMPFFLEYQIYTYLSTIKDKDKKYRFALSETILKQPTKNHYKGKVYVLINGGCFSATCLLSTNLHGSNRAIFIGQETGGAYNGCVAGIIPTYTLPKSKLTIKFGLLKCQSLYKSDLDGRGIFPNVEIYTTLLDRMNGSDPQLQWVLNQVSMIK